MEQGQQHSFLPFSCLPVFFPLVLTNFLKSQPWVAQEQGQDGSEVTVEGVGTETHQAWDLLPNPGGHCSKPSF